MEIRVGQQPAAVDGYGDGKARLLYYAVATVVVGLADWIAVEDLNMMPPSVEDSRLKVVVMASPLFFHARMDAHEDTVCLSCGNHPRREA